MKPTTARAYRAMLRDKQKKKQSEMVELPSGLVFELVRPDLQAFIITGRYPQSIVRTALKSMRDRGIAPTDTEEIAKLTVAMDGEQLNESLIFMREIVREACVNPRIVMGASEDDEIEPSELDIDDFNFIFAWCVNYEGDKNAAGILSFRGGQERRTAGDQPDGEILQQETVELGSDRQ